MSAIAIAVLMLALADETTTAPPPPPPKDTTALVNAAKNAKAKRKTSTTKVITNADVKKAKGTLIELPPKPAVDEKQAAPVSPIAKHEAELKAKAEQDARVAAAEQKVADLERELAMIEQQYYDEGDPNLRDVVIVRRFDATKALLEQARKDLSVISGR